MKAIKAKFDGEKILLPQGMEDERPGEVIVIFADSSSSLDEDWLAAQEQVLHEVWDNPEDAEYDRL